MQSGSTHLVSWWGIHHGSPREQKDPVDRGTLSGTIPITAVPALASPSVPRVSQQASWMLSSPAAPHLDVGDTSPARGSTGPTAPSLRSKGSATKQRGHMPECLGGATLRISLATSSQLLPVRKAELPKARWGTGPRPSYNVTKPSRKQAQGRYLKESETQAACAPGRPEAEASACPGAGRGCRWGLHVGWGAPGA